VPNPKHGETQKGDARSGVSAEPTAGGTLFDSAVVINANTRIGVDTGAGAFVVYRTDANGVTHGYQTTWQGLRNNQRAALQKAGKVTQRGKIIPDKKPNE
jgi:hypothetical protein